MAEKNYIRCPRCGGKGRYLCCNGFVERCNECIGLGQVRADKYDPKYYR